MRNVRKDDIVRVVSGDDRGKEGKVLRVIPGKDRVVVEGVNFVYKHVKPSQKYPRGGRIQKEAPVHASNVLPVCPNCGKAVRIKYKVDEDGEKRRICGKCGSYITPGSR